MGSLCTDPTPGGQAELIRAEGYATGARDAGYDAPPSRGASPEGPEAPDGGASGASGSVAAR